MSIATCLPPSLAFYLQIASFSSFLHSILIHVIFGLDKLANGQLLLHEILLL
jgi:hypothetical protein